MPFASKDSTHNMSFNDLEGFYNGTLPNKLRIQMADLRLPAFLLDGTPDPLETLDQDDIRQELAGSSDTNSTTPVAYDVVVEMQNQKSGWINAAQFKAALGVGLTVTGLRDLLMKTFGPNFTDTSFSSYLTGLPGLKIDLGQ